jgi:hypothetical protein
MEKIHYGLNRAQMWRARARLQPSTFDNPRLLKLNSNNDVCVAPDGESGFLSFLTYSGDEMQFSLESADVLLGKIRELLADREFRNRVIFDPRIMDGHDINPFEHDTAACREFTEEEFKLPDPTKSDQIAAIGVDIEGKVFEPEKTHLIVYLCDGTSERKPLSAVNITEFAFMHEAAMNLIMGLRKSRDPAFVNEECAGIYRDLPAHFIVQTNYFASRPLDYGTSLFMAMYLFRRVLKSCFTQLINNMFDDEDRSPLWHKFDLRA